MTDGPRTLPSCLRQVAIGEFLSGLRQEMLAGLLILLGGHWGILLLFCRLTTLTSLGNAADAVFARLLGPELRNFLKRLRVWFSAVPGRLPWCDGGGRSRVVILQYWAASLLRLSCCALLRVLAGSETKLSGRAAKTGVPLRSMASFSGQLDGLYVSTTLKVAVA